MAIDAASVRSAVDRPARAAPATIRWPPCSRSSSTGRCACSSGRSSSANGTGATRPSGEPGGGEPGGSARSASARSSGSGGSHGLR